MQKILMILAGLSLSGPVLAAPLTLVHAFNTADGAIPYAPPILDLNNNLFGTTTAGGTFNLGTVYQIAAPNATQSTLYSFSGIDGAAPQGQLNRDAMGNLYGTTYKGGLSLNCPAGCGTIFKLAGDGTLTTLYSFDGTDGAGPTNGLVRDTLGNLYGTTYLGGSQGLGTIFKLATDGSLTTLYNFDQLSGANPYSALIRDSSGNLYGTTACGGEIGRASCRERV